MKREIEMPQAAWDRLDSMAKALKVSPGGLVAAMLAAGEKMAVAIERVADNQFESEAVGIVAEAVRAGQNTQ